MNWTEHAIARAISLQTLAKKCVVLVDNCNWTGYECDVLGVTTDLRIIDVEVKISRADLKADARKDKWWERKFLGYGPREEVFDKAGRLMMVRQRSLYDEKLRLHPVKVWKHYYAMPAKIWKPELIDCLPSKASGVLLLSEHGSQIFVNCERRSTPNRDATRLKPEQVMDIARLANLRMWEAYYRSERSQKEASHWYQQVRAITGGLAA